MAAGSPLSHCGGLGSALAASPPYSLCVCVMYSEEESGSEHANMHPPPKKNSPSAGPVSHPPSASPTLSGNDHPLGPARPPGL